MTSAASSRALRCAALWAGRGHEPGASRVVFLWGLPGEPARLLEKVLGEEGVG